MPSSRITGANCRPDASSTCSFSRMWPAELSQNPTFKIASTNAGFAEEAAFQIMRNRGPRPTSGRRTEATIWALYSADTSPEIQLARPANAPSRGEAPSQRLRAIACRATGRGPAALTRLDSGQRGIGDSGSAKGSKPTFAACAGKINAVPEAERRQCGLCCRSLLKIE
jgi:hypothetical protein